MSNSNTSTDPPENLEDVFKRLSSEYEETSGKLNAVLSKVEKKSPKKFDKEEFVEKGRKMITIAFLIGLFVLMIACFFYCQIHNRMILEYINQNKATFSKDDLISIDEVIFPITSILGASLGFMIGYYFKGSDSKS